MTVPVMDDPQGLRRPVIRWLDSLRRCCFALGNKTAKSCVRPGLGMLFIFALVFIVYRPILPGNFLMDDHRLIKEDNPLLNGGFTPYNIWFQMDFTLSTFALWLQWL